MAIDTTPTVRNLRQAEATVLARRAEFDSAEARAAELSATWYKAAVEATRLQALFEGRLNRMVEPQLVHCAAEAAVESKKAAEASWMALRAAEAKAEERFKPLAAAKAWLRAIRAQGQLEQAAHEAEQVRAAGRRNLERSLEGAGFSQAQAARMAAVPPKPAPKPTPVVAPAPTPVRQEAPASRRASERRVQGFAALAEAFAAK